MSKGSASRRSPGGNPGALWQPSKALLRTGRCPGHGHREARGRLSARGSCPVSGSASPFKFLSPSVPCGGHLAIGVLGRTALSRCIIHAAKGVFYPFTLWSPPEYLFVQLRSIPGGPAFQHERDFWIHSFVSFQNYEMGVQKG